MAPRIDKTISIRTKLHYSFLPISKIACVRANIQPIDRKPWGLWYAWGNSWIEYCKEQSCRSILLGSKFNNYAFTYKLSIDYDRVLRIRTYKEISSFYENYKFPISKIKGKVRAKDCFEDLKRLNFNQGLYSKLYKDVIDWYRVGKDYDGIDIIYNDKANDDFYWYDGWDVSGGCIWHRRAIKKLVCI